MPGLAILFFVFLVGILNFWASWTDTPIPLPLVGELIQRWGWITGAFMAVVSGLFMILFILSLFSDEKLIIAPDRLQVVFNGKVHAQIPFRNIARFALVHEEDLDFLGIDLLNPSDADTFATNWDFDGNKSQDGWHFFLFAAYERELDEIRQTLEVQLAKHQAALNP